jgi:D-alanyl-D-alanine carboxypeptidase/D-alanyl-D-alanine-endopeptidase (penicillin-binding protein 4)
MEFYRIENRVRTVAVGGERRVHFRRIPGSRNAELWGTIPLRDRGESLLISVEDPAEYAARALKTALQNRGVEVGGEAVARHLYPADAGDLLQGVGVEPAAAGLELARKASAALVEDLKITDKVSQNLHAELALRAVGRVRRGVGSFEAGREEMRGFLGEAGIDAAEFNLMDGSGLSRLNLVTPEAVIKLLRFMYAGEQREIWVGLLPVGGQDGSLSARFGQTPAAGKVHAKTGSLSHVSALSGYIERSDGTWAAFSILVNNYAGPAAGVRGVMDRICNLIWE